MPVETAEPYLIKHTKDKGSHNVYMPGKKAYTKYAKVDFSQMSYSSAGVSKIRGAGIDLTSNANDLYPPHMRVYFIFKCA